MFLAVQGVYWIDCDMDTEDDEDLIRLSYVLISTLTGLSNEVPYLWLAVATRIYYKSFQIALSLPISEPLPNLRRRHSSYISHSSLSSRFPQRQV